MQPQTNTVSQMVPTDEYRKRAGIYAFDEVYDEQHSTLTIYDGLARAVTRSALDGVHGSIFAYGQTSSGKTYTMQGTSLRLASASRRQDDRLETEADRRPAPGDGIIQLAIKDMFDEMARRTDTSFAVKVSYIEVYNETIRDLLDPTNTAVSIREHPVTGVFTDNSERVVTDARGVLAALRDGEKNRSVGSTAMNERSSRSHSIFRVVVESRTETDIFGDDNQSPDAVTVANVRVGCLNFVDLAGSESVHMTGSKGKRRTEAGNINRSLLALSRVISALGSKRRETSSAHINFRDSKLTRILQPSLSGSARVLFICCASPADHLVEDTRSTLKFATRAKRIKLNVAVNEVTDKHARALIQMKRENQQLREQMEEMAALDSEKMNTMEVLTADLKGQVTALELAMKQLRDQNNRVVQYEAEQPAHFVGATDHVVVIDNEEDHADVNPAESPMSSLGSTERASSIACVPCSRLEDELSAAIEREVQSHQHIQQLERELDEMKREAASHQCKQVEILIADDDDEILRGTGDEELADTDMDTCSETDSVSPLTSPSDGERERSKWTQWAAQAHPLSLLTAVTMVAVTMYCVAGTVAAIVP